MLYIFIYLYIFASSAIFSANLTLVYYQALLLALHKLKGLEEQRKSAIDSFQPLVAFALSSGMYSSPAVSFDLFDLFSQIYI